MQQRHLPLLALHRNRAVSLVSLGIDDPDCLYIDDNVHQISNKSDFRFIKTLGFGQFGVEAWEHPPSSQKLAVKIVPIPDNSQGTNSKNRLVLNLTREIEALKRLTKNQSDFVVKFYGFSIFDGCCHLFMEIMDMALADLQEIVRKFPEDLIGLVNVAVVNGLCHLHELGYIHRDIKPDNLLINWNGQIKISDFGLTRDQIHTRARTIVGTVCYQPPELLERRNYNDEYLEYHYDDRVDSWSLGLTLAELAHGKHPYSKDLRGNWNIFLVSDYTEKLETEKLIDRCLVKNSNEFKEFVGKCLRKNFVLRAHCSDLKNHLFYKQYEVIFSQEIVAELLKGYKNLPSIEFQTSRVKSRLSVARLWNKKRNRITDALRSYIYPREFKKPQKQEMSEANEADSEVDKSFQRHEIMSKLVCRGNKVPSYTLIEEEMGGLIEVTRFEEYEYGWACKGEPDSITFKVSVPVTFRGICLYGPCHSEISQYRVAADLYENETGWHAKLEPKTYKVNPNVKTYQVNFPTGFSLNPNLEYTISVKVQGPTCYKGIHGMPEIERKLSNGQSVKVNFYNPYGRINTSVLWGQIPTFIFEL